LLNIIENTCCWEIIVISVVCVGIIACVDAVIIIIVVVVSIVIKIELGGLDFTVFRYVSVEFIVVYLCEYVGAEFHS